MVCGDRPAFFPGSISPLYPLEIFTAKLVLYSGEEDRFTLVFARQLYLHLMVHSESTWLYLWIDDSTSLDDGSFYEYHFYGNFKTGFVAVNVPTALVQEATVILSDSSVPAKECA